MSTLHVTQFHAGTGAGTLVLLHGFPVDSRMWAATASLVDASWQVLAVDLPGLGGSADYLPEPASMDASAAAVLDAIEPYVSGEGLLVLAGLSMGGYVVQAALRSNSELLDGVIFLDTRANADSPEAAANRLKIADESLQLGTSALVSAMASSTLSEANAHSRPELVSFMSELITSQRGSGVAWSQQAMASRPDSFDTLRQTTVPALVIVGVDDQVSPVDVMQDMNQALTESSLVVIADAGHMSPVEQPAAVAEAINEYLGSLHA